MKKSGLDGRKNALIKVCNAIGEQIIKKLNEDVQIAVPLVYTGKQFLIWKEIADFSEELTEFWDNIKEGKRAYNRPQPSPSEITLMP